MIKYFYTFTKYLALLKSANSDMVVRGELNCGLENYTILNIIEI